MDRKTFFALALIAVLCGPSIAQIGTKQRRPLPYEYGRVVINNYSEQANSVPVVFEHWIHRAKFSCRVCHVDIGFAMKAGGTGIRSVDNARGYYCGTCHNGKMEVQGKTVFQACSSAELSSMNPVIEDDRRKIRLLQPVKVTEPKRCKRCHSLGKQVAGDYDFFAFSKPLPTARFGNGIDWEKAEELGLLKPATFVNGVSPKPNPFPVQKDFELNPNVKGMPDIIFSHKKHTVWNGCELCHPDIFTGVKRGMSHYTMADISQGKSCGACHTSVAFPLTDCQRCHSIPVQP